MFKYDIKKINQLFQRLIMENIYLEGDSSKVSSSKRLKKIWNSLINLLIHNDPEFVFYCLLKKWDFYRYFTNDKYKW